MFDVLLESCAASPRRSGGALVSLVAHTVIIGAAALSVPCATGDGRTHCVLQLAKPREEPVRWVAPPEPLGPEHSGGIASSDGAAPPVRTPRPLKLVFSGGVLDVPVSHFPIWGADTVVRRTEWCVRSTDCTITARSGSGVQLEREPGLTTGSELAARLIDAPARPRYPESLRAAGLGGRVLVQFTVDTTGRVDPQAVRVLESTHELFSRAVLEVLPRYRFVPAAVDGRRVRMVAQMPFEFTIAK